MAKHVFEVRYDPERWVYKYRVIHKIYGEGRLRHSEDCPGYAARKEQTAIKRAEDAVKRWEAVSQPLALVWTSDKA